MSGYMSAGAAVICLTAVACIVVFGGMHWPRLCVFLTMAGVGGLAGTALGVQAHNAITAADRTFGQTLGRFTGVAVFGLVGLVVAMALFFHVWKNKIDTKTLVLAAAAPLTVALIPGVLGEIAVTVVSLPATAAGWGAATLLGIG